MVTEQDLASEISDYIAQAQGLETRRQALVDRIIHDYDEAHVGVGRIQKDLKPKLEELAQKYRLISTK